MKIKSFFSLIAISLLVACGGRSEGERVIESEKVDMQTEVNEIEESIESLESTKEAIDESAQELKDALDGL